MLTVFVKSNQSYHWRWWMIRSHKNMIRIYKQIWIIHIYSKSLKLEYRNLENHGNFEDFLKSQLTIYMFHVNMSLKARVTKPRTQMVVWNSNFLLSLLKASRALMCQHISHLDCRRELIGSTLFWHFVPITNTCVIMSLIFCLLWYLIK